MEYSCCFYSSVNVSTMPGHGLSLTIDYQSAAAVAADDLQIPIHTFRNFQLNADCDPHDTDRAHSKYILESSAPTATMPLRIRYSCRVERKIINFLERLPWDMQSENRADIVFIGTRARIQHIYIYIYTFCTLSKFKYDVVVVVSWTKKSHTLFSIEWG